MAHTYGRLAIGVMVPAHHDLHQLRFLLDLRDGIFGLFARDHASHSAHSSPNNPSAYSNISPKIAPGSDRWTRVVVEPLEPRQDPSCACLQDERISIFVHI